MITFQQLTDTEHCLVCGKPYKHNLSLFELPCSDECWCTETFRDVLAALNRGYNLIRKDGSSNG